MTSTTLSIGIDLGTTHCAIAQTPVDSEPGMSPAVCGIAQWVDRGRLDTEPLLPSFVYFPHETDPVAPLPWQQDAGPVVGHYARRRAAEVPGRVVSSAKSWLSHGTIDPHGPLLPLAAAEGVEQVSPIAATHALLAHITEAFAHQDSEGRDLADQDVVITVPASFDAGARDCTVEAALAAGLLSVTLLEEPQAAFYAWLDAQGDAWRQQLSVGDVVLVVDAGGGTIDFAAIELRDEDGTLAPTRIAVGQHILLGGDNMDLALAHGIKQKLEANGQNLDSWQLSALTYSVRSAKELLLSDEAPESTSVLVPSRGSNLLGASVRAELTQQEVEMCVSEGFFPRVDKDAAPRVRRRVGLRQQGLAYADDPAITAHLASFLRLHADAVPNSNRGLLVPSHVLFNGGVFRSSRLRRRLMETVNGWVDAVGAPPAEVLSNPDLDLAVARGASYYGRVRRGKGVRVRGGAAHSFYVGIESSVPAVPGMEPPVVALCVAELGMEEGTRVGVPASELTVVVGEAVEFRFFSSTTRREDRIGTVVETPEAHLSELAPISLTLPAVDRQPGQWVAVSLEAHLTEVGTLELLARPEVPTTPDECWRVELNVRSVDDE